MNLISRKGAKAQRKRNVVLITLSVITIFLAGCTDKNAYKKIDVSGVKTNVHFLRLEQDLFSLNAKNYDAKQVEISAKYADFYPFYLNEIMHFGKARFERDTAKYSQKEDVLGFVNDTIMRLIYDDTQKEFAKNFPEKELENAIKHFQFYFPKKSIANVITFVSGFQYGAITYGDSTLAIGLDLYLGANYPAYQNLDYPEFIIKNLDKKFIVTKSMEALYGLNFDKSSYNDELPLLEAMVEAGKKYYFIECMIPDANDSLIIGYSNKQIVFCKSQEKEIWKFFNERDLLYKTTFTEKKHYLEDAPSSTGMPQEAPGKVGAWVGWQIVRKFMRETNGQVSLAQLLEKTSAKEIVSKAHYKP